MAVGMADPLKFESHASLSVPKLDAGLRRTRVGEASWRRPLSALGIWLIALLAALPILAILAWLPVGGTSAWSHMAVTTLPLYVGNTALLMLSVGFFALVVGTGTAWLTVAVDFPGRRLFSWLLVLPLAAPAYIVAYVYTDLLAFSGPVQSALRGMFGWRAGDYWFPDIRSLGGAAAMLGLVLYPYVYLLARAAFAGQSRSQFLAARSLGMTPARAFRRVALPAARPAIAGGLALVLMETLADFGVAEYFAVPTFSTGIFRNWLAMGDKAAAMKLAAVMLLFVIGLVLLEAATRRGGTDSEDAGRMDAALLPIGPGMRVAAMLACMLPVLFGFAIPVLTLGAMAVSTGDGQGAATLWSYARDSLFLAGSVAIVATVVAVLLALAQRRAGGPLTRTAIRISTLGYALPGALLAVGLLAPLGQADQALTRFARDMFGHDGGLILTGTSAVLVYALTVRFLTVAYNSTSGGFAKVSPAMDAAARSLGAGPIRVFAKVQFPLVRTSLLAAALLVFIDTLRELPATLILRPFNLETLATRVYRLAATNVLPKRRRPRS